MIELIGRNGKNNIIYDLLKVSRNSIFVVVDTLVNTNPPGCTHTITLPEDFTVSFLVEQIVRGIILPDIEEHTYFILYCNEYDVEIAMKLYSVMEHIERDYSAFADHFIFAHR